MKGCTRNTSFMYNFVEDTYFLAIKNYVCKIVFLFHIVLTT